MNIIQIIVDKHIDCFQFWPLMNNAIMSIFVYILGKQKYSVLLGVYTQKESFQKIEYICLVLIDLSE